MANVSETTLLEKYDLQIDQLDYKFIGDCKNVTILENILIVLRSGEEGYFPHLIEFCEDRLREFAPDSVLLNPAKRILSYSDLSDAERKKIGSDIQNWSQEYKKEISKKDGENLFIKFPPVRGKSVKIDVSKKAPEKTPEKEVVKNKKCTPRSYTDWDKFDVDGELKKLDGKEEGKTANKNLVKRKESCKLPSSIAVAGLSEKERIYVANLEKTKGNEAFQAHDYEEAILYYTRSLSVFKCAITLNNRAQAYIKTKDYFAAIEDCTEVLLLEPNNIKALYRRGTAYKEQGISELAKLDFKHILELDPENKLAKEQLKKTKELRLSKPVNKRVVIEELETDEKEDVKEEKSVEINDSGRRLKIEEVSSDTTTMKLANVNYSSDEEDENTHLPPKIKQMLKINSGCNIQKEKSNTNNLGDISKESVEGKRKKNIKRIEIVEKDSNQSNSTTEVKNTKENHHVKFVNIKIEDVERHILRKKSYPKVAEKDNIENNITSINLGSIIDKEVKIIENEDFKNKEDKINWKSVEIEEDSKDKTDVGISKCELICEGSKLNSSPQKLETFFPRDRTCVFTNKTSKEFMSESTTRNNELPFLKSKNNSLMEMTIKEHKFDEEESNKKLSSVVKKIDRDGIDVKLPTYKYLKDEIQEIPPKNLKNSYHDGKQLAILNTTNDNKKGNIKVNEFTISNSKSNFKEKANEKDNVKNEVPTMDTNKYAPHSRKGNKREDDLQNRLKDKQLVTFNLEDIKEEAVGDVDKMKENECSRRNTTDSIQKTDLTHKNFNHKIQENQSVCKANFYHDEKIRVIGGIGETKKSEESSVKPRFQENKHTEIDNFIKEYQEEKNISENYRKIELEKESKSKNTKMETGKIYDDEQHVNLTYLKDQNGRTNRISAQSVKRNHRPDVKVLCLNREHEKFGNIKYEKENQTERDNFTCTKSGNGDRDIVKVNGKNEKADTEENDDNIITAAEINENACPEKNTKQTNFKPRIYKYKDTPYSHSTGEAPSPTTTPEEVEINIYSSNSNVTDSKIFFLKNFKNEECEQRKIEEVHDETENKRSYEINLKEKIYNNETFSKFTNFKKNGKEFESSPFSTQITLCSFNEDKTLVITSEEKSCMESLNLNDVENKEYSIESSKYDLRKEISPYEFLCTWWASNTLNNLQHGINYLMKIQPEELPDIISTKLDSSMLCRLLKTIYGMYEIGKIKEGESYLFYLTKVPRIRIVSMFLTDEELQDIRSLYSTLGKECGKHLEYVNNILQS